ncbi:hypothetical protein ATOBIA_N12490 [Atopobiaceae bacterium P1]|uniref:Uncharacterized protein n=1 Tax=Leptogranulimonas caecicola TaxID=2894156 RepID=A0AAU9CCJ5_9ACTN|nr:hypothetical protein ATOBIA_N12490 [Atopobiaceae bacterium P1]BDC91289.1 hypothetical protein ATTO_11610 [Leptogranulimonas caecicola]
MNSHSTLFCGMGIEVRAAGRLEMGAHQCGTDELRGEPPDAESLRFDGWELFKK